MKLTLSLLLFVCILPACLLSSCMSLFQHELSSAATSIPDAVRLAVTLDPKARGMFALIQQDLAAAATPAGEMDLDTYTTQLVDVLGDTPTATNGAVVVIVKFLRVAYEQYGNNDERTFAIIRQVADAIGDGLAPPPKAQKPTRF